MAMAGVGLEKEKLGEGYTPPRAWELDRMSAPDREFYTKIQLYNRAKNRPFDSRVVSEKDPEIKDIRTLRNEIVMTMLLKVEHFQHGMTRDVYEATSSLETLFDAFGLVFNGLGAVTGGVGEKAAYNAAAGGLLGLRNSLAKNFLAQQTQSAILAQMSALWKAHEAELIDKLNDADIEETNYSLQQAAYDVYGAFTSAWLQDAVATLAKTANEADKKAQEKLDAAKAKATGAQPRK